MINWTEHQVKVNDLKPYERNPRRMTKEAYARLLKSLSDFGYHQRIIAQPDFRIIGGHQRIRALKELGFETVAVLVPDRELTHAEFRQILVQDNLPFGDFDMDMLAADFDMDELLEWGMPPALIEGPKQRKERKDKASESQETCPHCGGEL